MGPTYDINIYCPKATTLSTLPHVVHRKATMNMESVQKGLWKEEDKTCLLSVNQTNDYLAGTTIPARQC